MSQGKGDTVRPSCVDGATWDQNWTRTFGQPQPGGDRFAAIVRDYTFPPGLEGVWLRGQVMDAARQQEVDEARARLQRAKDADAAFLRRLTGGG